jgi:hypothetical protein
MSVDSVTNKFPDGNFSRPRLAVFASGRLHIKRNLIQPELTHRSDFLTLTRHKQLCRSFLAHFSSLRRGRDSNPRYPYGHNGFQDRRLKPLSHLSVTAKLLKEL